jgi:hypothetical protein
VNGEPADVRVFVYQDQEAPEGVRTLTMPLLVAAIERRLRVLQPNDRKAGLMALRLALLTQLLLEMPAGRYGRAPVGRYGTWYTWAATAIRPLELAWSTGKRAPEGRGGERARARASRLDAPRSSTAERHLGRRLIAAGVRAGLLRVEAGTLTLNPDTIAGAAMDDSRGRAKLRGVLARTPWLFACVSTSNPDAKSIQSGRVTSSNPDANRSNPDTNTHLIHNS